MSNKQYDMTDFEIALAIRNACIKQDLQMLTQKMFDDARRAGIKLDKDGRLARVQ